MKKKVRKIFRSSYLNIMGFMAKPSPGVHIMNGHLLSMDEKLDTDKFDKQLAILSKKSTIIPFEEAVELVRRKKVIDKPLVAFSYDDGFEECYTHIAPILEKYNAYSCFFINPNFTQGDANYIKSFLEDIVHTPLYKRPMNWSQINELSKRGHIIGAHTMDHVDVAQIVDDTELHYQIGEGKKEIEKHLQYQCDYFAFPYGRLINISEQALAVAEQYYSYIFTASNWRNYYSFKERTFNRRHCEPYWPANHINYFLSKKIKYD